MAIIRTKDYRSDIVLNLHMTLGGVTVNVPQHDFLLRFFTENNARHYDCGRIKGELLHCATDDEDSTLLTCYIKNHGLGCGMLQCTYIDMSPNDGMEDGVQRTFSVNNINLELVDDISDDTQAIDGYITPWGTDGSDAYHKPDGGIPKYDLSSAVQASLGLADTALQSHQDISGKQDTLVSGESIKTVNGDSLLGPGNMDTKPPVVLTAVMTVNGYQVQDYSVDGFSSAWERGCICSLRLSGGHYDGFELMCIGFYLENGDKIFSFSCWTGLSLVVADLFADGSVSDGTLNMNSKQDVSPITNAASGALVVNEYRDFGTVSALAVTLTGGTMTNYDLYKFAFTCASDNTTLTLPSGIKLPVDMEMEMAAGRRFECVIDYANCLTFNCWDL